jgi:tetratricopeptide (TPR) repeat protein
MTLAARADTLARPRPRTLRRALLARRRTDTRQISETLEEIEGVFDRLAGWVTEHPREFLIGLGLVLLLTAGLGGWQWYSTRRDLRASEAVAKVSDAYFQAMGAQPGTTTFVEPANPETARTVRAEYAGKLAEVAEAHAGSAAAVDAWLLVGKLRSELGEDDASLAAFHRAVDGAPAGSSLRGLALLRLGASQETAGHFEDAARTYEEAGEIGGFPLSRQALALSARDWARAGNHERAVALADRLAGEPAAGPLDEIPAHLKARLAELRATR